MTSIASSGSVNYFVFHFDVRTCMYQWLMSFFLFHFDSCILRFSGCLSQCTCTCAINQFKIDVLNGSIATAHV